jgi:hypothetical protein
MFFGALMALGMIQQTDTLIPVEGATLLDLQAMSGSVVVEVWDRPEVSVRAEHSRRTSVRIDRRGSRIALEAEARRGPANHVDYQLTVPASMNLKIEGMLVSITVNGALGTVEAETLQGDVAVYGGRGNIKAASMSGSVLVEGAEGSIDVESVAGSIRIVNSSGDIVGETIGGPITLDGVRAASVDLGSVGGDIWYDGTFAPGGTYFFGTHGGVVTLVVPDGAGAQFEVSTVMGSIFDNLGGDMRESERGERARFESGDGGAIVEVETFGGRVHILRQGTEGDVPPRGDGMAFVPGMGVSPDLTDLLDGVAHAVSAGLSVAFRDHHKAEDTGRDDRPAGGN